MAFVWIENACTNACIGAGICQDIRLSGEYQVVDAETASAITRNLGLVLFWVFVVGYLLGFFAVLIMKRTFLYLARILLSWHNTWEPEDNVLDQALLDHFLAEQNKKKVGKKRQSTGSTTTTASTSKAAATAATSPPEPPAKRPRRLAGGVVRDESSESSEQDDESSTGQGTSSNEDDPPVIVFEDDNQTAGAARGSSESSDSSAKQEKSEGDETPLASESRQDSKAGVDEGHDEEIVIRSESVDWDDGIRDNEEEGEDQEEEECEAEASSSGEIEEAIREEGVAVLVGVPAEVESVPCVDASDPPEVAFLVEDPADIEQGNVHEMRVIPDEESDTESGDDTTTEPTPQASADTTTPPATGAAEQKEDDERRIRIEQIKNEIRSETITLTKPNGEAVVFHYNDNLALRDVSRNGETCQIVQM